MLGTSLAPAFVSVLACAAIGWRLMPSATAPPIPNPPAVTFRNWRRLIGRDPSIGVTSLSRRRPTLLRHLAAATDGDTIVRASEGYNQIRKCRRRESRKTKVC